MENMEIEEVCYTIEVALEKAIEMEMKSFQAYKKAYLKIKEPRGKDLVKDLALEENANDQDVMIHAIHDERRAVDFTKKWRSNVVALQWRKCF